MSEVIDISLGNLDSSMCFFQPSISHDVLCMMPGASMRNSTRDKVMRQSSDGKANQTSGFPPGIS